MGVKITQKGELNHNARTDTSKVIAVCRLLSCSAAPYSEIAANAGVSLGQVQEIAKGRTWQHISCEYNFLPRAVSVRRGR